MRKLGEVDASQLRLADRIANLITQLDWAEFTSQSVATAIGADRYDVLFALHQLKNEGKVIHLRTDGAPFADAWHVSVSGTYEFEQVKVTPIWENHRCR